MCGVSVDPHLRLSGRVADPFPLRRMVSRGVLLWLGVLNPVAWVVGWVTVFVRQWFFRDRVRWWQVGVAGVILSVVGVMVGLGALYVTGWVELWGWLVDVFRAVSGREFRESGLPGFVFDWRAALLGQIPLGACLGVAWGSIQLWWRDRYSDSWNEARQVKPPASEKKVVAAKARLEKTVDSWAPVVSVDDLVVSLGVTIQDAEFVSVGVSELRTHCVVGGPTGTGKTEMLMRLLWGFVGQPAAQDLGLPGVLIDMKGDGQLAAWMEAMARETGRDFYRVTVDPATSNCGYEALGGHSADEVANMVFEILYADNQSKNEHYMAISQRLLQVAAQALVDLAGTGARVKGSGRAWRVNLSDLARLCSPAELTYAIPDLSPCVVQVVQEYLVEIAGNEDEVGDIQTRLRTITGTAMGRILASAGFTRRLDMRAAIEDGALICFSLDAAAMPEAARVMGRLAVQDLSASLGGLQNTPWTDNHVCPIILDEFSALLSPKVGDLFARARSAGGIIILSTQDVTTDLVAVSPKFAGTVRTNANVWCVFKQPNSDTADAVSRDIGSEKQWKVTKQVANDWDALGGMHVASGSESLREMDEFRVSPDELKGLGQGSCLVVVRIPAGSLHKADVMPDKWKIHVSRVPNRDSWDIPEHTPREEEVPLAPVPEAPSGDWWEA